VYTLEPFAGQIDTTLQEKLVERIGYYIRTELKDVFGKLNPVGNRYSIKVPITPEERALFKDNVTSIEFYTDEILQTIEERYLDGIHDEFVSFLEAGYLQSGAVRTDNRPRGIEIVDIVKNLVKRGILLSCGKSRRRVKKTRDYAYDLTVQYVQQLKSMRSGPGGP
jgi:hypothetical protein